MGVILTSPADYDAIRYALGLNNDQDRLLTDDIIDALPHLPTAELEARNRFTPPVDSNNTLYVLLARDPKDWDLIALKCGVVARCCANLCHRIEITIPAKQDLAGFGNVERHKIDWLLRRQQYINDANMFWAYISQVLHPQRFPNLLTTAPGRISPSDPGYSRYLGMGPSSDFAGYTSPTGMAYAVSVS